MTLKVNDFIYDLPKERIASYPLANRDESKLLLYRSGKIEHLRFPQLTEILPDNTLLYFNNTKVIPARIHFTKETGADIEAFLLEPISPSTLMLDAMQATGSSIWKCAVGNLKRWPSGTILRKQIGDATLYADLIDRNAMLVKLTWDNNQTFAEIISVAGKTPLPPYIKRGPDENDKTRYQTIYSAHEGAVAAPTAGLHFTSDIMLALSKRNINTDYLTLHVSAGTFQPIKVEDIKDHEMHKEQIVVTRNNLINLLKQKFVVPVGTTSMRTLESIFWFGAKLNKNPDAEFFIGQHDPYTLKDPPTVEHSVNAVVQRMDSENIDYLTGETSIMIMPGYQFKVCKGLITNFHQPGSTLILLVAALIGDDWKRVYSEALSHDYRFLSYGDSSLLLP